MIVSKISLLISIALSTCAQLLAQLPSQKDQPESILKIEMNLSAFGVESEDFPSIDVTINFTKHLSSCRKWFYNPTNKDSVYALTEKEMESILSLLNISDLRNLQKEYRVKTVDQPRSRTVIHTNKRKFEVDDYGMKGEYPLQVLYQIVYKY
jgi:hypothetical protein